MTGNATPLKQPSRTSYGILILIRVCLQRRDESNNFWEQHVYRWRKPWKKYSFLGSYSERDSWLQTGVLVGFAEIPIHRYKIYFEHIPKPLRRWMKLFSWWQTATSIVEFRSKVIIRLYLYIPYIYSNKKSYKNVTAYREGRFKWWFQWFKRRSLHVVVWNF